MSDELALDGITINVPRGWEAELGYFTQPHPESDGMADGRVLLHLANFPLPTVRGDYGSGAVELMDGGSVFIALLEWDRGSINDKLYARVGLPTELRSDDFSPQGLQRRLPGQCGTQRFFQSGGRAFGLYVVLGSYRRRDSLVAEVNRLLRTIRIDEVTQVTDPA
jgi:hypothetical protein